MNESMLLQYKDAPASIRNAGDALIAAVIKHDTGMGRRATDKAMKARARLSGFLLCFTLQQGHQMGVDAINPLIEALLEDYRQRHHIKRPTPGIWEVSVRQSLGEQEAMLRISTWEKGEAAEAEVIQAAIAQEFAPVYGYGYSKMIESRTENGYTEVGLKLPGDQVQWTGRTYHANLVESGISGDDMEVSLYGI